MALITQIGEQVDYLRFMPEKTAGQRAALVDRRAGRRPGLGRAGRAEDAGRRAAGLPGASATWCRAERAVDPNQMYLAAYEHVFAALRLAVAATALFVVVSQLKINVTNAYAGSLAWSNFFARLTHSHPGRVVWVVFNTLIALMLMELDVFQALGQVLGLYSNIAIAWIMAVVADLVINKPLGLSPQGHRVQAAPPVRHQPGRRGRDGHGLGAVDRGLPGRVRRRGAGLLGVHRAGHGLRRRRR